MRRAGVVCACLAAALVLASVASPASRPPTGAVKVVRAWIAAWSHRHWAAACRLESHSQGGGTRRCIRGYRSLYAPYRPQETFTWLDRFRAGYRIVRTRARFIPSDKCQAYVAPGVGPA